MDATAFWPRRGTRPPAAGISTARSPRPRPSFSARRESIRDARAAAQRRHPADCLRPGVPARTRHGLPPQRRELTALTGLPTAGWDTPLTPRTLSTAALIPLARALNTPPESLLRQSGQAPRPNPQAPTHASILHAALLETGRIHRGGQVMAAL